MVYLPSRWDSAAEATGPQWMKTHDRRDAPGQRSSGDLCAPVRQAPPHPATPTADSGAEKETLSVVDLRLLDRWKGQVYPDTYVRISLTPWPRGGDA